jgi:hypothetical protein
LALRSGDGGLGGGCDEKLDIFRFEEDMTRYTTHETYILIVKGRGGLAPKDARVGDFVAIFLDANTPYVIRDKGDINCELIGDTYLHGLMYGEDLEARSKEMGIKSCISVVKTWLE